MYRVTRATRVESRKILRLTLALPGQTTAAVEEQVSAFIEYARLMRLDLTRQWWCLNDVGKAVGACMCIESPGRTAMIFLPCASAMRQDPTAMAFLVRQVFAEEQSRGIRLVQSLVHPGDTITPSLLGDQSFRKVADLIYLEREIGPESTFELEKEACLPFPVRHEWWTYSPPRHALFAETILVTYEDSMDCSGLAGLRQIEDIIEGHKSAGVFEPRRWRLLVIENEAAGCILLAANPLQPHLELVYVGVCPNYRGRGLGRRLVCEVLAEAHHENFQKVTLAVDEANTPALNIYKSLNFSETARRGAWVRTIAATPSVITT